MTCVYCEEAPLGGGCEEIKADYAENAYLMQDIVKHGATMEYECSLGREFLMENSTWTTSPTDTLTCNWDTQWYDQTEPRDYLHPCVCEYKLERGCVQRTRHAVEQSCLFHQGSRASILPYRTPIGTLKFCTTKAPPSTSSTT